MNTRKSEGDRIACGIAALAREHGSPNNFTAGEIADAAHVARIRVGLFLSRSFGLVNERLAASGYRLRSYYKHEDGYSYVSLETAD